MSKFLIFFITACPVLAQVNLIPMLGGLERPTAITSAADGSGRLFVAEQSGTIRLVRDGALRESPFLDIRDRVVEITVKCCDERGLLGVAFPPGFAEKRYFYVNYIDRANTTIVSRFSVTDDPDIADPSSEVVVLRVPHDEVNHNGGQLAFSPLDGRLYIAVGDGVTHHAVAQKLDSPLGKILRMDVEQGQTEPEIWTYGLRNPWRFSFDRQTGDLFIGDVGADNEEEVNFVPAGRSGDNFGWDIVEGHSCFEIPDCPRDGLTTPVATYTHNEGCSVIGGYVYRGRSFPQLNGTYFYTDFCTGRLWALVRDGESWQNIPLRETELNISTFGEDEAGELYAADFLRGTIYRLTAD